MAIIGGMALYGWWIAFVDGADGPLDPAAIALGAVYAALLIRGLVGIRRNRLFRRVFAGIGLRDSSHRDWFRFKKLVLATLREHAETISEKRASYLATDDYGSQDNTRWMREVSYVAEKVIWPRVSAKMGQHRFARAAHALLASQRRQTRRDLVLRAGNEDEAARQLVHQFLTAAIDSEASRQPIAQKVSREIFDPTEYEHFCAGLLRGAGWNAVVQGGSGDQGVDIVAERNGEKAVFQCKLYSGSVGNSAVQQVYAGKSIHRAHSAYVVTNIGYTPGAKEAAAATGVVLLLHDELETL